MTLELLTEIPETVTKIFHLGSSASNLGLRCPTVLAFKGSIALINGESGTLYRKYILPSGNAIIEDCAYVSGSRCFVMAMADKSIISVPEQSKFPSECEIEKWPCQPRRLISPRENELLVYCEGGSICHVSMKENRVKASLLPPVKLLPPNVVSGSDICVGNRGFVALFSSSKKSTKAHIDNLLSLFKYEPISSGSSRWLENDTAVMVSIQSPQNYTVSSAAADEQCGSVVVVMSQDIDGDSCWIKFDSGGCELFRRNLPSTPKYVFSWGGVVWFYDDSSVLSGWNSRFGNKLEPVQLPPGTDGVPCIVAAGSDGHGMQLLVSCVLEKHGSTNIMKKEIGSLSRLSNISVLDVICADKHEQKAKEIAIGGICNDLDEVQTKELYELKLKLYKRTLEDLTDSPQSSKRRKKLNRNFTISYDFLSQFEGGENCSIHDEDWELCKALIRMGVITMHSNPTILSNAASQERLDILAEAVTSMADLTETQFVQILKYSMAMPTSTLRNFIIRGTQIVSKVGDFHRFAENLGKPLSSVPYQSNPVMLQLEACKALIDGVLSRSSSFSQALLSEAMQIIDVESACILLRSIAALISNVSDIRNLCCDEYASVRANDIDMERAVAFVEAVIDAHFLELSIRAPIDENIRRALFDIIKIVKKAESVTFNLEETFAVWTQIERVSSKHGVHVKHSAGTYQVEKLVL